MFYFKARNNNLKYQLKSNCLIYPARGKFYVLIIPIQSGCSYKVNSTKFKCINHKWHKCIWCLHISRAEIIYIQSNLLQCHVTYCTETSYTPSTFSFIDIFNCKCAITANSPGTKHCIFPKKSILDKQEPKYADKTVIFSPLHSFMSVNLCPASVFSNQRLLFLVLSSNLFDTIILSLLSFSLDFKGLYILFHLRLCYTLLWEWGK